MLFTCYTILSTESDIRLLSNSTSSGFAMILLSLHLCDEVSIYGFSYRKSKQTHYYEKGSQGIPTGAHDVDDEYRVLRRLHSEHVINWVQ